MRIILIGKKKIRWKGEEKKEVELNLYMLCTIFFVMIVTFAGVEFISHEPLRSDIKLSKIECLHTLIRARDYFDTI